MLGGAFIRKNWPFCVPVKRLAARYGVEISSVQTIGERVANDKTFITSDKQINQSVKNQKVKAQIRATWHDTQRDELWVWIYPIN